jgi:hypothetical protein
MATRDDQLQQILSKLTTIAEALAAGTPPPRTPASPEQAQTIVDYLVLREVVGRPADEISRVISAIRRTGGVIAFPDTPPIGDDTQVAVFTERGTPAEVRPVEPKGTPEPVGSAATGADGSPERTITGATGSGSSPERTVTGPTGSSPGRAITGATGSGGSFERTIRLRVVADGQPIIRIEIRDGDGQAVALGPRLAAVV